jgi:hypothetical protein
MPVNNTPIFLYQNIKENNLCELSDKIWYGITNIAEVHRNTGHYHSLTPLYCDLNPLPKKKKKKTTHTHTPQQQQMTYVTQHSSN